ncbi:helix-turn-helix transcriptional regulator [Bifidobacterium sp. SO1]|uniref:helix-turn-helix domain-containing protein n=1 Tax=Bifidobacterium sp. SO1 TaxID=2809029 RepID=UPI001BDBDEE7|nr:helix-turn-helix transcriptional regulator [Bifidobacterium sp. SO1]
MNSATQNLSAAGIRYRLYISNKSQRWLAKQLGWDVSRLSRRLAGKPAFKVDELDTIAEILGVDFDTLLSIPIDMRQKFFGATTTVETEVAA